MPDFIVTTLLPLLYATMTTLFLALTSLIVGLILAFLFTSMESCRLKPIAWFTSLIVTTVRSLPEILIVIAIYNGIPFLLLLLDELEIFIPLGFTNLQFQIRINDTNVSPITCGITALSLLYAAYASQTLRGAFKAIPIGQKQAAEALGLSKWRTLLRISIPQIWRHALPGLGNQWLVLLKDTALVSLIAINDIMKQTSAISLRTHNPFTWYLVAAGIYLIISLVSQRVLQKIESRVLYYDNATTSANKEI